MAETTAGDGRARHTDRDGEGAPQRGRDGEGARREGGGDGEGGPREGRERAAREGRDEEGAPREDRDGERGPRGGLPRGSAPGEGAGAPDAPDDGGDPDDPERALAAMRAVRRSLGALRQRMPVGEGLAALLADGRGVYDLGQPVDFYGDGIVGTLEERVADLLGTEDAAFFPTGTMAQQVALRCWAARTGNTTVALHPMAHPEVHERGALGTVSGLRTVHPTTAPRQPTADEVRAVDEPFGTLMLELPLREAGFLLPSWDELTALVDAAREREAVVHVDGARLWECTTHLGRPLEEIAGLADSVYVSFYKSLGGLGGAALAGPRSLTDEARAWRHRYGGQVFQQFPTALAALIGLDRELPRLPEYVAHARVVARALRDGLAAVGVPWARVHPREPHTHQFQVWLPYDAAVLDEAALRQAEETGTALFWRWAARSAPGVAVTEVTVSGPGLAWTPDDVKDAVADFVGRLPR